MKTPPQPVAEIAREEEWRATLLTVDGKGKKAKEAALNALILSAAAKMVRETGACDAMLKARSELEYTWARLGNRDAQFDKTHAELCAALQSLRALTEQPGKP